MQGVEHRSGRTGGGGGDGSVEDRAGTGWPGLKDRRGRAGRQADRAEVDLSFSKYTDMVLFVDNYQKQIHMRCQLSKRKCLLVILDSNICVI